MFPFSLHFVHFLYKPQTYHQKKVQIVIKHIFHGFFLINNTFLPMILTLMKTNIYCG